MNDGKYFEYNIPKAMPMYINNSVRPQWNKFYQTVSDRFDLLQMALDESGMRGEDFSAAAQKLFSKEDAAPALDTFDPYSLAYLCQEIANTFPAQPDRMIWPNADTICDTAFLTTEEWEFLRSVGIGGSEAAAVAGCATAYVTPRSVYHRKIHTTVNPYFQTSKDNTFVFSYGHHVEDLVIETFLRKTGATRIPETRMFRSREYPFLIADMDGIVTLPDGRLYIFEAKTSNPRNKKLWEDGCIPPQYDPQCRHYMGVMNDPRVQGCFIACIYGNTEQCFKYTCVERDIPTEEEQNKAVEKFWNNHILAGREPSLSINGETNFEEMKKYHGKGDTSLPALKISDSRLFMLMQEAEKVKNERIAHDHESARLKTLEQRYNSEVADAMGQCTAAVISDGGEDHYNISWSSSLEYTVSFPTLKKQYPQAFQDCTLLLNSGDQYMLSKASKVPVLLDMTALRSKYPDVFDAVTKVKENRTFTAKAYHPEQES